MKCETQPYVARGRAFVFDGKPSERIRSAMKSAGFRWSPSAGLWWRSSSGDWANLFGWIVKELEMPGASMESFHDAQRERIESDRRRIAADDFDLANNRSL